MNRANDDKDKGTLNKNKKATPTQSLKHKYPIQGLTRNAIIRLARKAGITRLSQLIFEEVRGAVQYYLEDVLNALIVILMYEKVKTVQERHINHALEMLRDHKQHSIAHSQQGQEFFKACEVYIKTAKKQHAPGKRAKKEVSFYKKQQECMSISQSAFKRLVSNIYKSFARTSMRASKNALVMMQVDLEHHVISLLERASLEMKHAQRETLYPKDIQMIRRQ
jgi:hypothetical protein